MLLHTVAVVAAAAAAAATAATASSCAVASVSALCSQKKGPFRSSFTNVALVLLSLAASALSPLIRVRN